MTVLSRKQQSVNNYDQLLYEHLNIFHRHNHISNTVICELIQVLTEILSIY